MTHLGPSGGFVDQGREVQLLPPSREQEDAFAKGVAKKLAGKPRVRGVGKNGLGQIQDF